MNTAYGEGHGLSILELQQILGSCSPASTSTIRVPPNPITIETIPSGSASTSSITHASRPSVCRRIRATLASAA
jgi:hypothetical protein